MSINSDEVQELESFTTKQGGVSRAELEVELDQMRRLNAIHALNSLKTDLRIFRQYLEDGFPFITKLKMRRMISTILGNHRV